MFVDILLVEMYCGIKIDSFLFHIWYWFMRLPRLASAVFTFWREKRYTPWYRRKFYTARPKSQNNNSILIVL
jgi:hypothetical protein